MMRPKRILVATDFSDLSALAVGSAFDLARNVGAEKVHLIHIIDEKIRQTYYPLAFPAASFDPEREHRAKVEQHLESIVAPDLNVQREVRIGIPARDIADAALANNCDVIVVATHGFGPVRRALLGSVTSSLVRTSTVPVLVVGERRSHMNFDTVLAGVDLSPISDRVLGIAAQYTSEKGQLQIVSAYELPLVASAKGLPRLLTEEEVETARLKHVEAVQRLVPTTDDGPTVRVEALAKAPAALAILESAQIIEADLIVIGTSGHNAWHRMFLGSTATRVLAEAECPVLVVPTPAL